MNIPFNAIPVSPPKDDTGKRVLINSVGGPSWPNKRSGANLLDNYSSEQAARWSKKDKFVRALENIEGTVLWGPCHIWFMAKTPKGERMMDQKFISEPYWSVMLDGYNLETQFIEREITFIR